MSPRTSLVPTAIVVFAVTLAVQGVAIAVRAADLVPQNTLLGRTVTAAVDLAYIPVVGFATGGMRHALPGYGAVVLLTVMLAYALAAASLVSAGASAWRKTVTRRRARCDLCIACGHPRIGAPQETPCPECGSIVKQ